MGKEADFQARCLVDDIIPCSADAAEIPKARRWEEERHHLEELWNCEDAGPGGAVIINDECLQLRRGSCDGGALITAVVDAFGRHEGPSREFSESTMVDIEYSLFDSSSSRNAGWREERNCVRCRPDAAY